jgi:ribosomal protein L3 glutamine methyltransferase
MAADTTALKTIQDLIRWGASRFAEVGLFFGHGTDNAFDEAAWLVADALYLPIERIDDYRGCRVTADERATATRLLERRLLERRPAAYLTGRAWFAGLELTVDEAVMIPRSPIAELIEAGFAPWIDPSRIARALDLCTGSGCIGLAIATHLPHTVVDLADISPAALRVAAQNRARYGLADRIRIIESDLFANIAEPAAELTVESSGHLDDESGDQPYDLIVSNPPYVGAAAMEALPPEYRHEPRLALAGGETGLDLVLRILRDAPDYLSDEGLLVVEVGESATTLEQRLSRVPFTWVDFERGGDGVFVMGRDELVRHHPLFSEALADL